MDVGPDGAPGAGLDEPVLGASSAGEVALFDQPQLALVDPALAERARQLLPEPRARLRPRTFPGGTGGTVLEPPARGGPRRVGNPWRRCWPRAVALAVVIFVARAASGSFLGEQPGHSPDGVAEAAAVSPKTEPTRPKPAWPKPARPKLVPTGNRAALRPPKLSRRPARKWNCRGPGQRRRACADCPGGKRPGRRGRALHAQWGGYLDVATPRRFRARRRAGGPRGWVARRVSLSIAGGRRATATTHLARAPGTATPSSTTTRRGDRSTGVPSTGDPLCLSRTPPTRQAAD